MKRTLLATLSLMAVVGIPAKAWAHAVETNYLLNGDGLEFQSSYSSGEPLKGATVQIFAPNQPENPWQEITADDQGKFAFNPDESIPGDWEVVIRQEGHDDIWTVPVDAQGVEFDEISDGSHRDIHYASSPLLAVGSGVMAALLAGGTWVIRRYQART